MAQVRQNVQESLRYYLASQKVSQKELAEKLNVSQSAVTNWVKGKNSPDIETIVQICDVLNIYVSDLLEVDRSVVDPFTEEVTAIFKKLNPQFQKCAIDQMKRLLELQNQNQNQFRSAWVKFMGYYGTL